MPDPKFELTLRIGREKYKSKADSITEAVDNLRVPKIGSWAILAVRSGEKKHEQRMRPMEVKRLMVNRVAQQVFQKRMLSLLK